MVRTPAHQGGVTGMVANSPAALTRAKLFLALRYVYSRPAILGLSLDEAMACSSLAYKGKLGDATTDGKWIVAGDAVMKSGVDESWITGFRAVLLNAKSRGDSRVILAFAGTDPKSVPDILTDLDQALNISPFDVPSQYVEAASLAETLLRIYQDRLLVTGHSLGGGLANYVSVRLGIRGAGVNAAPLGAGTLLNLYLFGKDDQSKFTHYNNNGELVSSYAPGLQVGQVCEIDNTKGVLEGHMLENVDPNAPMICYDDYLKRKPSRGVTGTW
jgi:hypothetical protein